MAKAWRNTQGINVCTVSWHDASGVLLTSAQIAAAQLVFTQAGGFTTITAPANGPLYYLRITPNSGAGMGSSALRVTVQQLDNVEALPPRWDGTGTWPNLSVATLDQPATSDWSYIEIPVDTTAGGAGVVSFSAEAFFDEIPTTGVNCSCSDDEGNSYRTLKQLRDALFRRLGFGNQLASPPPGMKEMLDSFLQESQVLLWHRFTALRTIRFFSWPLRQGAALYALGGNAEDCPWRLAPDKILEVGIVKQGLWNALHRGIPLHLNTYDLTGRPTHYEIRSCVQLWPAPDETEGSLIIRGAFGLLPFTADDDVASINDSLIFALALADAKAHYRQPDADRYVRQAEVLLANLVASTHAGKRYIPGRSGRTGVVYVPPRADPPFGG